MTWSFFRCSTLSLSNVGNLTNCIMRSGPDRYSYVPCRAPISFGENNRVIEEKHVTINLKENSSIFFSNSLDN